jgi:glutathione synthase/RimK-type ligase-like ATP-grasp enzyme
MRIGILAKRETGLTEKLSSFYSEKGHEVTIYTANNLQVNFSLIKNDFYILKSKQLLFLYAGYFLHTNKIPVIPDPIISYKHKHRVESYYSIKKCGLNTPKIYMGTPQSVKVKIPTSEYPLIVKDLMGSGSKGIKIIDSPDNLKFDTNKIIYLEKYIEGTHYLAYFMNDEICVGEKQPLANEHAEVRIIKPEKDIKKALMAWRAKYNLLFGHLDMIREKKTKKLIVVDAGTFPEFTNWKSDNNLVPTISKLILERYLERRNNL